MKTIVKAKIHSVEKFSNGQMFVLIDSKSFSNKVFDPRFFSLTGASYMIPFRIKFFKERDGLKAELNQVAGVPGNPVRRIEEVIVDDTITLLIEDNKSIFSNKVLDYYPVWKDVENNGLRVNSVIESDNKKFRLIKKVAFGYQNLFVNVENDDDEDDE